MNKIILLGIWVLGIGYVLNRKAFQLRVFDSLLLSPLSISLIISIASAFLVYFFHITLFTSSLLLFLPALILVCFIKKKHTLADHQTKQISQGSFKGNACSLLSLCLCVGMLGILIQSKSVLTTLGPWEIVPPLFFVLFFLTVCLVLTAVFLKGAPFPILASISALFFVYFSIGSIVYPLGFGFDPLLHTAAERVLLEQGMLTPKTFYYNGHYGLMTFLSLLSDLPVEIFDRFFVTAVAALALPLLLFRTFCALCISKSSALLATILIIILTPLAPLSSLTPWGHAFFLALVTILASVLFFIQGNKSMGLLAFVALLAVFAIHPLAGIPLLGFMLICQMSRINKIPAIQNASLRSVMTLLSLYLPSLAIVGAFFLLSKISSQLDVAYTALRPKEIISFFSSFFPAWEWRFHALLDPVYAYEKNLFFLLLLGALSALIIVKKCSPLTRKPVHVLAFGSFSALLAAITVRGWISFPSLPSYEQAIYSDRIREISVLFLIILSMFVFAQAIEYMRKRASPFVFFCAILFFSSLGTMHIYASYPHNDAYIPYHGYTISKYDIEAVHWIANDAGAQDYVVLSNQVTAAASIKEFGFKKYYPIDKSGRAYQAFYYSIPAASPLHDAFLHMLAQPSGEIIADVMSRARVPRVYFVIHSYEPRFRNIIDKTRPLGQEKYSSDGDEITVFRFSR